MWSRDIFAVQGFIHLVIMQEPAGHHHTGRKTDVLNLWQNYMNCEHYFFLISALWCSALDRVFVGAVDGVGGWLARFCVCQCVLVCQCVGVCQFVSSGAYRTWTRGATVSLGGMNYSRLCRCKTLVYLSARRCARPGTLTQISGCSRTVESVWEVRET